MKFIKYLLVGIIFGITLTKAEVISCYRIYEMFRFQSFHMYGVIGSTLMLGMISVFLIKRFNIKSLDGAPIIFNPKHFSIPRYIFGGTIFGFGWAMTGACPGPLFILLGNGIGVVGVILASAVLGTYVYGILRTKLPH